MERLLLFTMMIFGTFTGFCQSAGQGFPGSQVLKDSTWSIGKRVDRQEIRYLDQKGKIVVVEVIKARLKKNRLSLEAATPDNKPAFGRQEVPKEIKAENSPGRQVVAGVNADFFNMNNGTPLGPVVKDGSVIKGVSHTMVAFVGVLKSGKIIMGDSILFKNKEQSLKEALGARPLLVTNGQLLPQNGSGLSTVHHPRTAFGVKGKSTVFLVTVDGRQPDFSNGISLTDLGQLMRWLGADNAVNLDGGGSTTMAVWDQSAQEYIISNRPSGKILRPVANSWILVRKQ